MKACEEIGVPYNPDVNGAEQFGAMPTQVSQINGERGSAAKGYLGMAKQRPNLTVLTEALTHKVIIQNKKAVGVQFSDRSGVQNVFAE